jgi:hypothetical protein
MIPSEFDFRADLAEIARHNGRRNPKSKTWIHTEVSPIPFEGRLGAPVSWLLANPSFDPARPEINEPPPLTKGWPLQSLAPAHRSGYGAWTYSRLAELINELGAETVARNVLVVQLCAWASESFHEPLRLPSRAFARRLVLHQIQCGSVFVLVRSREPWLTLVPELKDQPIILTAHTLTAHLSRGNLGDGWNLVAGAIRRAEG